MVLERGVARKETRELKEHQVVREIQSVCVCVCVCLWVGGSVVYSQVFNFNRCTCDLAHVQDTEKAVNPESQFTSQPKWALPPHIHQDVIQREILKY